MKKLVIWLMIIYLQCGCVRTNYICYREERAGEIISNFANKMEKKGLMACGTGLGIEHAPGPGYGKQNFMSVSFQVDQVLTIESGRKLCIQALNEFLKEINNDIDFRNYLVECPYTNKYVRIIIFGGELPRKNKGSFIKRIIAQEGDLYYYTDSRTPPTLGLIHKETYEEAICHLEQL